MKKLLTTAVLAAAAVATMPSVFAANTSSDGVPIIYIAGATTFRAPVTKALITPGVILDNITYAYDQSSANPYKAGAAIFHGNLHNHGGTEVYIETFWTGSLAGVYDVATSHAFTGWIDAPTLKTSGTGTIPGTSLHLSGTGTNINGSGYSKTSSKFPDAAMSDSFASTIAAELSSYGDGSLADTISNAALDFCGNQSLGSGAYANGTVGIAPFVWVAGALSSGSAVPFSNMNQQVASSLVQGATSLACFTGSSGDVNNYVVCIGRNEDSGTRIAAFSESQAGLAPANIGQYLPAFSGTVASQGAGGGDPALPEGGVSATVTSLGLWPTDWNLNTESAINWASSGHSGFNGGGDVANALAAKNPVTGLSFVAASGSFRAAGGTDSNFAGTPPTWVNGTSKAYLAGYLGVADAIAGQSTVTPGLMGGSSGVPNGTLLTYNGVAYSVANVQNGLYTFWTNEHMYYNTSNTTESTAYKFAMDDLAEAVFSTYANTDSSGGQGNPNAAGILYNSSVIFGRNVEGGNLFIK